MSVTPNMDLTLATPEVTLGPLWAQILNTALGVIDLHDHSQGNGVQITPAGILINDTLEMNSNYLAAAIALGLSNQAEVDTAKAGSIQRFGTDLYWVNGAGAAVQITSGSSVVSTGSGVLSPAVPGAYPFAITTANAQQVLIVDSSVARTLTLPPATDSMTVFVKDGVGSANLNPITVTPDGTDTIDTVNASVLVDFSFGCIGFISNGVSGWYAI